MNLQDLRVKVLSGQKFEYEFFLRGPFSQWVESKFTVDGVCYKTAEHWMMAEKARLFGDLSTRDQMLKCSSPKEVKALGRKVSNFKEDLWTEKRYEIVYNGNFHKFTQNESFKEKLIATGDKILVEASPVDCIWGIGLSEEDENSRNPLSWKGLFNV